MSRLSIRFVASLALTLMALLAGCSTTPATPTQGGGSATGQGDQSMSPTQARALVSQALSGAAVDRATDTITYRGQHIRIVMLASPVGSPAMRWNLDGLVNPTLVVPHGAEVTVEVIDADQGTEHAWELTSAPPPYAHIPTAGAWAAFTGAVVTSLAGATADAWSAGTATFTAATSGTYYYVCQVPDHAQRGMYGRFVVQ